VGKFITRMRRGDAELQDQVWVEARHLYDTQTPLSESIRRLLELAGENPNAFHGSHKKATQGLTVSETQTMLRLVATASIERDDSHRVGVRLPSLRRHSAEEKALAAMPVAESFRLLSGHDPRLVDAESNARQLVEDHRGDADGGASLREAVDLLLMQVLTVDPVDYKRARLNGSISATGVAARVIAEHLGGFGRTGTYLYRARAGSWWPPGD
jgi:hypothetical protein